MVKKGEEPGKSHNLDVRKKWHLCRGWFWEKRVEDVYEKWFSEILAQNGEETSREERGGEE